MRHGSSRNAVIRYNNTRTDRMRTESENGREKLNLVTEQLEPRITAEVYYAICVCNWLMMPTKCTLKEDELSADRQALPTAKIQISVENVSPRKRPFSPQIPSFCPVHLLLLLLLPAAPVRDATRRRRRRSGWSGWSGGAGMNVRAADDAVSRTDGRTEENNCT